MTAERAARVELFLTIAIPLLPVLWFVLALQTAWLRTSFKSATVQWIRNGGLRRSRGNLRATMWSWVIVMCFVYGGLWEALSLVAVFFGWRSIEELAAGQLLFSVLLALALVVWALTLQVGARVDAGTLDDEKSSGAPPGG